MTRGGYLVVAALACNGKAPSEPAGPVRIAPSDAALDGRVTDAGTSGDLNVRVEWPGVPVAARTSPGRTPCRTPRAPSVAPTTTWGVPDALVVVEGAPAGAATARLTLADCALAPKLAVGMTLVITSAVVGSEPPAKLTLRKRGTLAAPADGEPIAIQLPIAGHSVTLALDAGALYSLETDGPEPEVAYIAAIAHARVSDAAGVVSLAGLAVGAHAVTAWLPPRAGQPARTGGGSAHVAGGELAELTVSVAPPPSK